MYVYTHRMNPSSEPGELIYSRSCSIENKRIYKYSLNQYNVKIVVINNVIVVVVILS